MVGSFWDHKLNVRVDVMGLTLKPTDDLLGFLINETSVSPAGQLLKAGWHHGGPHLGLCAECLCSDPSSSFKEGSFGEEGSLAFS